MPSDLIRQPVGWVKQHEKKCQSLGRVDICKTVCNRRGGVTPPAGAKRFPSPPDKGDLGGWLFLARRVGGPNPYGLTVH